MDIEVGRVMLRGTPGGWVSAFVGGQHVAELEPAQLPALIEALQAFMVSPADQRATVEQRPARTAVEREADAARDKCAHAVRRFFDELWSTPMVVEGTHYRLKLERLTAAGL